MTHNPDENEKQEVLELSDEDMEKVSGGILIRNDITPNGKPLTGPILRK